jgi:MYXO-CTERM domain-containing protein
MQRIGFAVVALSLSFAPRAVQAATCTPPLIGVDFLPFENAQFTGSIGAIAVPSPVPSSLPATAVIDWGDGTSSAADSIFEGNCNTAWVVNGTHTYPDEGCYTVSITATDPNNGSSHNLTGLVVVYSNSELDPTPSPTFSAQELVPFSGQVFAFNDSNTSELSSNFNVSIDWADGGPTSAGVVSGTNGFFTVSGDHTYQPADLGWVSRTTNLTASLSVTEHMTNPPPSPPPQGMTLWLRADANVVADAGNAVSSWGDSSGNANDAVQANAAKQPTLVANAFNGLPGVRFSGSSQFLTTLNNMPGGSNAYQIFVVAHSTDNAGSARGFIGWGNFGTTSQAVAFRVLSTTQVVTYWWSNDLIAGVNGNVLSPTIWETTYNGIGGLRRTFQNGILLNSDTPSGKATGATPAGIGVTNLTEFFEGDIAEILVYDGKMTETERRVVEAYLHNKYALPMSGFNDTSFFGSTAVVASEFQVTKYLASFPEFTSVGYLATFSDVDKTHVASDFEVDVCFCGGGCFDNIDEPGKTVVSGSNGSFDVFSSYATPFSVGGNDCFDIYINLVDQDWGDEEGVDYTNVGRFPVSDAPIAPSSRTISARPKVQFTGEVASFHDASPRSTPADYTAVTIDWGDGSALDTTGTVVSDGIVGWFSVVGTHTYDKPSATPLTIVVVVTDGGGSKVTINSTANVADSGITVQGMTNVVPRGFTESLLAATFLIYDTSAKASDLTATIDWGDGSTVDTATIKGATGSFDVRGSHAYSSVGSFSTKITVTDTRPGGGTATGSGTSTVNGGQLTLDLPGSIEEFVGVQFTLDGSLTDLDPNAAVSKYVVTVKWGDGSMDSTATVTAQSGGVFNLSADHTYSKAAMETITVSVADSGGNVLASGNLTANVTVQSNADGGSTTSGNGSSGGCGCVVGGSPSTPLAGPLVFVLFAAALLFRRRRA